MYQFSVFFQYKISKEGTIFLFVGRNRYTLSLTDSEKVIFLDFVNEKLGEKFEKEVFLYFFNTIPRKIVLWDFFIASKAIFPSSEIFKEAILWQELNYNPSSLVHSISKNNMDDLFMRSHQERKDTVIITKTQGTTLSLIKNRRTTRIYSQFNSGIEEITYLLQCTYGNLYKEDFDEYEVIHKTAASGGGFWPLNIYLFLCDKKTATLYLFNGNNLISLNKQFDKYDFFKETIVFNPNLDLRHATGLIVITANLDASGRKYGANALQLALLEGGHASQNFVFACEEIGFGNCELGGVFEEKLLNFCGANKSSEVFINAILFGKK